MSDKEHGLPIRSKQDPDQRVQIKVVDFTAPSQGMEIDTDNDAHVKAKFRDDNGDAFGTPTNPVAIFGVDNPADSIHEYDKAVDTAKAASTTHSYSPSASAKIKELVLSASGMAKWEIAFGVTSSEVEKYVIFNSVSEPSKVLPFASPIELASTDSIVITKTNLDNQAQDVYSTINGVEA